MLSNIPNAQRPTAPTPSEHPAPSQCYCGLDSRVYRNTPDMRSIAVSYRVVVAAVLVRGMGAKREPLVQRPFATPTSAWVAPRPNAHSKRQQYRQVHRMEQLASMRSWFGRPAFPSTREGRPCRTMGDVTQWTSGQALWAVPPWQIATAPPMQSTCTFNTTTLRSSASSSFATTSSNADDAPFMVTTSSLGDIMRSDSSSDDINNGVGQLVRTFGITHPLDRLALTANGNLQRLVASYYDAPVTVWVESCTMRPPISNDIDSSVLSTWDRRVQLQVYNQTFCTATSVITIHSVDCQALVATGRVGLGQLFRYWDILPNFTLHDAARSHPRTHCDTSDDTSPPGGGGFWRDYTLASTVVTCRIHEEFATGLWSMVPLDRPLQPHDK